MNFTSQICTTEEQSKRLLVLGLKRETADCVMMYYDGWHIGEAEHFDFDKDPVEPAWSLHRLIEMIPCGFQDENYRNFVLKVDSQDISYVYNYVDDEGYGQSDSIDVDDVYHNLYDGIIAHIKWLIKEGLFNKEYLEE